MQGEEQVSALAKREQVLYSSSKCSNYLLLSALWGIAWDENLGERYGWVRRVAGILNPFLATLFTPVISWRGRWGREKEANLYS